MKTSKQMKNEFEGVVEEVSTRIKEKSYEFLDDIVEKSFREFCQEGKINVPANYGNIWRDTLRCENLSEKYDSEICKAIAERAEKKLEESLAKVGWKLTMRVLEPISDSEEK